MIFALSNMVPGIAISYDGYKSVGIMKDMGLDEFVLDIKDISSTKLQELFSKVILKRTKLKGIYLSILMLLGIKENISWKIKRE